MANEKFQNKYRVPSARAAWHDYGGGAYFVTVCTKNKIHSLGEIRPRNDDDMNHRCRDGACPVFDNVTPNDDMTDHKNAARHVSDDNTNDGDTRICRDAARHVSNDDDMNNDSILDAARPVSTVNNPSTVINLSPIGQYLFDNIQNVSEHYPYAEIPVFVVMPNHWHAIVCIDGDKTPYPRRDANDKTDDDITHNDDNTRACRDVARRVSTVKNAPTVASALTMKNTADQQPWLSVTIGGIKSAVTKYARENGYDFAWQTRFHDRIIRDADAMNRIAEYIENNPAAWEDDCYNDNDDNTCDGGTNGDDTREW